MIVLDSGAITALAEGEPGLHRALQRSVLRGVEWASTAAVVAETTTGRGPADAKANRVLVRLRLIDVDEKVARRAGALRHRAGVSGVVDALVVATAEAEGGGVVLTGDLSDLRALAAHARSVEVNTW